MFYTAVYTAGLRCLPLQMTSWYMILYIPAHLRYSFHFNKLGKCSLLAWIVLIQIVPKVGAEVYNGPHCSNSGCRLSWTQPVFPKRVHLVAARLRTFGKESDSPSDAPAGRLPFHFQIIHIPDFYRCFTFESHQRTPVEAVGGQVKFSIRRLYVYCEFSKKSEEARLLL